MEQNGVYGEPGEGALPVIAHVHQIQVAAPEIRSVEITSAVDENAAVRVKPVDDVIAPLVIRKDIRNSGFLQDR